ncbi:hypothetical protein MJN76_30785, partial [Salmonella enterica subsp. enterica serovar Anatum]|nr:hypothetical protein [Salmonella enterica subsp. enterica serovar Anatum]
TDGALSVLAARWGLEHDEDNPMALVLTPQHLELRKRDEPKLGDALPEQPINAFFAACRMTPLVLLQSGNMPYRPQYASHAVLSK